MRGIHRSGDFNTYLAFFGVVIRMQFFENFKRFLVPTLELCWGFIRIIGVVIRTYTMFIFIILE